MRYDPWQDLRRNWPEVRVLTSALPGDLLGVLRYPVIVLRAGTTAAQRRCTLAHEIVHLERGLADTGPWAAREEHLVHREAARRLITLDALCAALVTCGGSEDLSTLAQELDVDAETLVSRVDALSPAERAKLRAAAQDRWVAA